MKLLAIFVLAYCVHLCACDPLIKVFCSGGPLFRGRLDSIVNPGIVSGHVHKVAGGSNFGPAQTSQTPEQVYEDMRASPCTTCSIPKVDLSAYWHPELYYRWPNGSLELVPTGGLTVYYLGRSGYSQAQAHPERKAFPRGFRMLSGNPFRRTYDPNSPADNAVTFACLSEPGGPETHNLSVTADRYCVDGLRLQIHFPQCWDGVNIDSPNHMDHVAFPIQAPDNGDCPDSHPVRTFDLFFEAFYSIAQFPHGPAPHGDGKQHFVLSCGDDSGNGFHGDFLNGWDVDVLQAVLNDPSCDQLNTNNGNNPERCAPVSQYVLTNGGPAPGVCSQNHKSPLTENLGYSNLIETLPGCNPITTYGQTATPCSSPTSATEKAPVSVRFHLRSELNQKYWSCPNIIANSLTASVSDFASLTYYEVFVANYYSGEFVSLANEGYTQQFLSASGSNSQLQCDRGTASDWEAFEFVPQPNGHVAIISKRNNLYLTTHDDGTIVPDSATIGQAQLFTQVVPQGGTAF
eukprot:Phypoly_transcript_06869.p1 GENE.Phypoly_transcript_06869~~Phypoly_transcript_06869.p1  ORF type:complete len:534 (+),score=55.81 Phypoly_transcript_06869:56-1603(+)